MKIISFSWTTPALIAGRKSRTRRQWSNEYAKRFKTGDLCQAYDRQPRFGGKIVAIIRITGIKHEHISEMTSRDFELEGFSYMEEQGMKIWGKEPADAFNEWMDEDEEYWVIDFEIVKLVK